MRSVLAFAAAAATFAAAASSFGSSLDAKKILDKVDDLYRGGSSHSRMSMKVVTSHYTREMTFEEWTKGKERSLIRILSPRKEKGTATLKVGNEIWNFLPKIKRVIS